MTDKPVKEIERSPEAPELSEKAIKLLTDVCFRKNDPYPLFSEGLFIFGSASHLPTMLETIAGILKECQIKRIFISGGVQPSDMNETEAEIIYGRIRPMIDDRISVFYETSSKNSLENVAEFMKVYDFKKESSICFVQKYHACGRAFLTLKKFLPEVKFEQRGFVANGCDPDDWFIQEKSKKIVWGEFLRIYKYGSRGDTEYSPVQKQVLEVLEGWDTTSPI